MKNNQKKGKSIFSVVICVILCLSLSACKRQENELPEAEQTSPAISISSGNMTSAGSNTPEIDEQNQETGAYSNQYFSLSYPEEIMHLEEQEFSDDGQSFLISLTKRGEDIGSIPRIDIISVDIGGLTEDAVNGLSADETNQAFESFAASLLTAYYNLELDEQGNIVKGTAPVMEFRDTDVQVVGEEKFCETRAAVSKTDDLPEMHVAIRLQGKASDGLVSVILAQKDLDEESNAMLESIIGSLQLN